MNRLRPKVINAAVVIFLLVAGFAGWKAWESKSGSGHSMEVPKTSTQNKAAEKTQAPATGTVIAAGNSEFGKMLFSDKGQAIYIFEVEKSAQAKCYGNCAAEWPPVQTDGTPRAGDSINQALLGTTKRTDGSTQVTYNGHPLYYYAHEKAGEVKCHNVSSYGGLCG